MFFVSIRIVLFLIVFIFSLFIMKKMQTKYNIKIFILLPIFCALVISVTAIFPIENIIINNKTPEDIFNYTKTGKINGVIYGEDSCMVVYSTNGNDGGYYIIPKDASGYKIPNYFTTLKVYDRFDEKGVFKIFNANGTQDYYVFGVVHLKENDNDIKIYRNEEEIESNIIRVDDTNFIYFNLPYYSEEFYMMINGEKVTIFE